MSSGATTPESYHEAFARMLASPKSTGLVVLTHEIADATVTAFITAFPLIAENGWRFESLAEAYGGGVYQNAASSTSDDVVRASIVDGAGGSGDDDEEEDPATTDTSSTPPPAVTQTNTLPAQTTVVVVVDPSPTPNQQTVDNNSGSKIRRTDILSVSIALAGMLATVL